MPPTPDIQKALDLLKQTDDREKVDFGFETLLNMADSGDATAAAYVGYASQFKHIGHYDLDRCKEYLEKSVAANNPTGQFYMGSMN